MPIPTELLQLSYERRVRRRDDLLAWKGVLLPKLEELLDIASLVKTGGSPKYQVIDLKSHQGFRQSKISFPSHSGSPMIAYLLIPDGLAQKRPGLVVIPGHGVGAKGAIGDVRDYQQAVGKVLAEAGYVVIVPELLTFGERSVRNRDGGDGHVGYGNYVLELGRPLIALQLAEVIESKRILQELAEVDRDRIGVVGISVGGKLAYLTAAVDQTMKVVVVASGLSSLLKVARGYDPPHDQIPGLLRYADTTDLAGLVVPRPMLLQYGEREWGPYGYEARGQVSYRYLRAVYEMMNRPDDLVLDIHPGGHTYNLPKVIEFLERHL
jgi:dienelactone hydrolase